MTWVSCSSSSPRCTAARSATTVPKGAAIRSLLRACGDIDSGLQRTAHPPSTPGPPAITPLTTDNPVWFWQLKEGQKFRFHGYEFVNLGNGWYGPASGIKGGPWHIDWNWTKYMVDGYTSPFTLKKHVGKKIVWYDPPFVRGGNGTTYKGDFIVIIKGTDDKYCSLGFSVSTERKVGQDAETLTKTAGPTVGADDPPCPASTKGACCDGANCSCKTGGNCTNPSVYKGNGTTCNPNPCP